MPDFSGLTIDRSREVLTMNEAYLAFLEFNRQVLEMQAGIHISFVNGCIWSREAGPGIGRDFFGSKGD